MALPTNADVIVVHGFWVDELTGAGVTQANNLPTTIVFDPVPLLGADTNKTPNLRDLASNALLKTRTRVATVDPQTGYFATLLVASNDPDLTAYGGRKVTLLGENPFIIEVPYNAPTVTVDTKMAAKTGLPLNSSIKAIWLTDATVIGSPPPQPSNQYLTSTQTLTTIANAIDTALSTGHIPTIASVTLNGYWLRIAMTDGTDFAVQLPSDLAGLGASPFGSAPFGGIY